VDTKHDNSKRRRLNTQLLTTSKTVVHKIRHGPELRPSQLHAIDNPDPTR